MEVKKAVERSDGNVLQAQWRAIRCSILIQNSHRLSQNVLVGAKMLGPPNMMRREEVVLEKRRLRKQFSNQQRRRKLASLISPL